MSWLTWGISAGRKHVQSAKSIQHLMKSLGLPAKREEGGIWTLLADIRDTYRVRLSIWSQNNRIYLMTSSEVCIERDLITRELMLLLLEWNSRLENSAFRLVSMDERRVIALVRVVDLQCVPENGLAVAARGLIETMQVFISKALAIGQLIHGPHQPE